MAGQPHDDEAERFWQGLLARLETEAEQIRSLRQQGQGTLATGSATIRYFGGAKAAAGIASESVALPVGATVHDLLSMLTARHGESLARVLAVASLLLDEVAVHDRAIVVRDGAVLDVLPPTAGG